MRQAEYNLKMKWLTYFNSHNTSITISCYSIAEAVQIIKDSGINQVLLFV